ncbi:unnamed protein product [Musa acuminata subsp. malaccensis]|uniref:(wild Malaysian banana) hypothetical protein n=1 Tax=Musa acuminata subsp. malaccensis TaxID=214687 RepID=A0A804IVX8_MUSAM|nr:unnamed protein product [Musa acuminata subsp. malaccensis]
MASFEYHGSDPWFNKLFNGSMRRLSTVVIKKLLQVYRAFRSVKVLVDVGGGTGITLQISPPSTLTSRASITISLMLSPRPILLT